MITLAIEFDPTNGSMRVNGSPEVMGNLILAMGLLEAGKQAMIDQAKAQERRVQPASIIPPGFPIKP